MNAAVRKKSRSKARQEETVEVPMKFLADLQKKMEEATETVAQLAEQQNLMNKKVLEEQKKTLEEQAQLRLDMDKISQHFTNSAVAARDETMRLLKTALLDERTPEETAADPTLYPNVLKAPGARKAMNEHLAGRARIGKAAKSFGASIDEWIAWCEKYQWPDRDRCPRKDERAYYEGQGHLFGEEPPQKPKPPPKPRGRPKGSKDSKPRKKRVYAKRKPVKAEKK